MRLAALRNLLLTVLLTLFAILGLLQSWPHDPGGRDFGALWSSARALTQGEDPYAVYPLTLRASFGDVHEVAINRNTPLAVMLYLPVAHLSPLIAFRIWYCLSLGSYAVTLTLLIRAYPGRVTVPRLAWLLAMAPIWDSLSSGGFHAMMASIVVAATVALDRKRWLLAGVCAGILVAIKPHFAFWALALLLGGYGRVVLYGIGAGLVASAVPLGLFGSGIYSRWLAAALGTSWLGWPANVTLPALGTRLGAPALGFAAAGLVIIGTLAWIWRHRPPAVQLSMVGVTMTLLTVPPAWPGYLLSLLPAFVCLTWNRTMRVAAALLLIPVGLIWALTLLSPWILYTLGSTYCLILLLLLSAVMRNVPRCLD